MNSGYTDKTAKVSLCTFGGLRRKLSILTRFIHLRRGIWTSIEYMIPWVNPSPQPKRHLDWFSSFCRAH